MTDRHPENRRLWDEWSDDFRALWNATTSYGDLPPTQSPFAPGAPGGRQPGILDSVGGKDYVELGCGGGQASVGTAQLGAGTAVGVDFSGEQSRHAQQLREFAGVDVRFLEGDVTDLPLADDEFDIASSEWVSQMVEHLDRTPLEFHRGLRAGSVFVLSVPRPVSDTLDTETGPSKGSISIPGLGRYRSTGTTTRRWPSSTARPRTSTRRSSTPGSGVVPSSNTGVPSRGDPTYGQRPARDTMGRAGGRSVLGGCTVTRTSSRTMTDCWLHPLFLAPLYSDAPKQL